MPGSITLSKSDLAAMYWWPFPPDADYLYDYEALKHWVHDTMMVAQDTGAASDKSRWVAMATVATIRRAVIQQEVASKLGDGSSDQMLSANRSDLTKFVDDLIASPPICELVPLPPLTPVVIVVPVPVPVPTPVPPEWEEGEELSKYDVLAVAAHFQTVVDTMELGPLAQDFATVVDRLFEVAQTRM